MIGAAKPGSMGAIGAILMGMVSNIGVLATAWFALGPLFESIYMPAGAPGVEAGVYLLAPQGGGDVAPVISPGLAFGAVACVLVAAFIGGTVSAELASAQPMLVGVLSCMPLAIAMVFSESLGVGDGGLSWAAALGSLAAAALGALAARRRGVGPER